MIFTSVSFGPKYNACLDRLAQSIQKHCPDAKTLFYKDSLPPGAKSHEASPYGFKIHAIREAAKISEQVIWVDSTCIVVSDAKAYYDPPRYQKLQEKGVLVAEDSNKLVNFVSPELLATYGVSVETSKDLNLVGGSLYVWDFRLAKSRKIFDTWTEMEQRGLCHSTCPFHRHDEACMAIALHLNDSHALSYHDSGYRCDTIVNKDHWKEHV